MTTRPTEGEQRPTLRADASQMSEVSLDEMIELRPDLAPYRDRLVLAVHDQQYFMRHGAGVSPMEAAEDAVVLGKRIPSRHELMRHELTRDDWMEAIRAADQGNSEDGDLIDYAAINDPWPEDHDYDLEI